MKIIKRRAILVLGLALVVATLALSAFTFAPMPASSHGDTVHCIHVYGLPWRTVGVPAPAGHWVRHGRFCLWEPVR